MADEKESKGYKVIDRRSGEEPPAATPPPKEKPPEVSGGNPRESAGVQQGKGDEAGDARKAGAPRFIDLVESLQMGVMANLGMLKMPDGKRSSVNLAEAQNIIDAQRSRGLELEKGNLLVRVKNMVPILIPLIINSIKRAFSIAEALESKAFGAIKIRTNYYELKMRARDYAVIAIMVLFVVGFFVLYFGNLLPGVFYFTLHAIFPNL